MIRLAAVLFALFLAFGVAAPTHAQTTETEVVVKKPPRTKLRVQPLYPYRTYHTPYPPGYRAEYPGPNAHRECTDALVVENRPSGTVVVPRSKCRWVRGRYNGP